MIIKLTKVDSMSMHVCVPKFKHIYREKEREKNLE